MNEAHLHRLATFNRAQAAIIQGAIRESVDALAERRDLDEPSRLRIAEIVVEIGRSSDLVRTEDGCINRRALVIETVFRFLKSGASAAV